MSERVRGVVIHRPIIYGNSAVPLTASERGSGIPPDHTHRWTVAIRSAASVPEKSDYVGGADDLSYFIKRVTFRLHETYPTPNRNVDKSPFEVTETGKVWGEFDISIRITFVSESAEKTLNFQHHLKLHPWVVPDLSTAPGADPATIVSVVPQPPLEPVYAWQYDEIVFTDPPKAFLDILMAHPPTPLPKVKKRAIPPNPAHTASLAPQGSRWAPEFTVLLERDEGERLDAAKRSIVEETDKQRALLIEKEQELERLKKELESQ